MASLAETFLRVLGRDLRAPADLEARLGELVETGRAAWPGLDVSPAVFVGYAAARIPRSRVDLGEAITSLRAGDLYLACGCARGDPKALAAFDDSFREVCLAMARRVRSPALSPEDAVQRIWKKLFVPSGEREPKIALYGGRGALKNWLRATVARALIDMAREGKKVGCEVRVGDEALWELPAAGGDPLLGAIRGFNAVID